MEAWHRVTILDSHRSSIDMAREGGASCVFSTRPRNLCKWKYEWIEGTEKKEPDIYYEIPQLNPFAPPLFFEEGFDPTKPGISCNNNPDIGAC